MWKAPSRTRTGREVDRLVADPVPGGKGGVGLGTVGAEHGVAGNHGPERPRDGVEPAGADPVDALLVLVLLLVSAAGQLGHLLQAQAEPEPPLADPRPDVAVHVPRAGPADGRPWRRRDRTARHRRSPPARAARRPARMHGRGYQNLGRMPTAAGPLASRWNKASSPASTDHGLIAADRVRTRRWRPSRTVGECTNGQEGDFRRP